MHHAAARPVQGQAYAVTSRTVKPNREDSGHRAVARCRVPAATNQRRMVVVSAASRHSSTRHAGIREKLTDMTATA
jgi:hypothetical protein